MATVHTILTHPGGAHKDDLIAVCVLIAIHQAPVVRREPTKSELEDCGVAVVDIGGVHDPERSNFDHHGFPREHPPSCALSLILDHLDLYKDAQHFCDWLLPAEWFDSRGPKKTAQWLGVPRRVISQLNSPIDITLLRRFSKTTQLEKGDPLYEVMRYVGEDLLEFLRIVRQRIDIVAQHAERWSIAHQGIVIETIFLPRTDPLVDEPSIAVGNYIRDKGLEDVIAAIVYPDRRGAGYGIGRYEDHPKLDFSRVQDQPDVHFAHTSGFMCKTTATSPTRLKSIIMAAWTE